MDLEVKQLVLLSSKSLLSPIQTTGFSKIRPDNKAPFGKRDDSRLVLFDCT